MPDTSVPEAGGASTGPSAGDTAMPPIVNLQIVSPSTEVGSPLSFQLLPVTTTVKDLKERIRNALEVSPSAESQRLIYRGRMLARDTETLLEIFGEETLKTSDQQTFHLVLRPPVTDNVANQSSNPQMDRLHARTHVPGTILPPRAAEHPGNSGLPPIQPSAPGPRRSDRAHIPPYQQPLLPHPHDLQQREMQHRILLQRIQMQHDELTDQLNFLTQDQRLRAILANLQNQQAALAQHTSNAHAPAGSLPSQLPNPANATGNQQLALPVFQNPVTQQQYLAAQNHQQQLIQQQLQARVQATQMGPGLATGPIPNNPMQSMHQPPSRTQSPALPHGNLPDHTTTITRHGVGSNGERWQITVNESTTVIPPGNNQHQAPTPPGNGDVTTNLQHVLQTAERLAALQARLNNLTQRPGGTPPPGFHAHSAPQRPASTPPIGRVARPTTTSTNSYPIPSVVPSTTTFSAPPSSASPVVYILSSPSGPQALLLNNSQTFYSPGYSYLGQQTGNAPLLPPLVGTSEVRNRRERTHRHRHRHRDANVPVADGAAAAPAEQAQNAHQNAEPLRVVWWPHIWLVIRLLIFVYFFTSGGNSSWSRLFVIWGIALFLFIVNTGAFNDIFGTFWNPIRHHLENLLPLAGPNPQPRDQQDAGNARGAAHGTQTEPNPEEVARRLLAQRRQQDAGWLMQQFRRVEHAVLLFVASIVPGTAERHIEARTIEENRLLEQRRQEAAAAAAALEPTPAENQEGEVPNVPTDAQPEAVGGNEHGDANGGAEHPAALV